MQILLACAKTMNEKTELQPLSVPLFQTEAEAFARDMMQYPSATSNSLMRTSQSCLLFLPITVRPINI